MTKFSIAQEITFIEEPLTPYTVRAIGPRYAVLTRPCTAEDAEQFEFEGDWSPEVVYTIVDSETWLRGTHDLVFNPFDFQSDDDCNRCLREIEAGQIFLSRRNSTVVHLLEPVSPQ